MLGTAAIVNLWKVADPADTTPSSYIKGYGRSTSNTINGFTFSSTQAVIKQGEYVAVNTQSAQPLVSVWFAAMEVPEAELWKVD